jgi:DNA-binding MarR family transcriptional regulator
MAYHGAMAARPDRLSSKPSYLTTQLARHVQRMVSEAFEEVDARGYHYRLLATIDEVGPTSQAELGRGADMDRSDVVAAVNELVAAGQVERAPDPADGRRNVISLTPAGRRQLRRLDRALERTQERFLEPLTSRDRERYTALVRALLDHHESTAAAG